MNIIKLLLIFFLCLPSFAGIKAVRSATNPATSISSDGKINLVITSNTPRTKNYYDSTGFHLLAGVLKEGASTNILFPSNGTTWDTWANAPTSLSGTPIYSTISASELTTITNALARRIQYTAVSGDTNGGLLINSPNTSVGTFSTNDTVSFSIYVKSRTGFTGVDISLQLFNRNAAGTLLQNYTAKISPTTEWRRFCMTEKFTHADTSRANCKVGVIKEIADGDSFDFEFLLPQIEKGSACTSYIPTTTEALTRNAETYSNLAILFGD